MSECGGNIPNKHIDNNPISDTMCAPGVNFLGGSCITLDILLEMVNIYNKTHQNDKIDLTQFEIMRQNNPITFKKKIVEKLKEKLKQYKCDNQMCWVRLPIFDVLSSKEKTEKLHHKTFKPHGPRNTNEWLNTIHINEVCRQYEEVYKDFKFFGAHPRDFDKCIPEIHNANFTKLLKNGINKVGFIFNLDTSRQSGSHWVALFSDLKEGKVYFIDSVGTRPQKEFSDLMKKIRDHIIRYRKEMGIYHGEKIDMRYSKKQHQHGDSECGVYAISFILRLLDGEPFDDLFTTRVSDSEIKLCRTKYFGN